MADQIATTTGHVVNLLNHRLLLENLIKVIKIKLWVLANEKVSNVSDIDMIKSCCVDILKNGLKIEDKQWQKNEKSKPPKCDLLRKFSEELNWLCRRSMLIRDVDFSERADHQPSNEFIAKVKNAVEFLSDWTARNLQAKTMCASIQALVTEKELLQNYYDESAFLRNEYFVNALVVCLTAFELNQCSILCQIDENLLHPNTNVDCVDGARHSKHKRTSSHPNFTLPVSKSSTVIEAKAGEQIGKQQKPASSNAQLKQQPKALPVFRKVKSLPAIPNLLNEENSIPRPRSKTMNVRTRPPPKPNLTKSSQKHRNSQSTKLPIKVKCTTAEQAASSLQSCSSQISNSTIDSNSSAQTSASKSDSESSIETKDGRRIELINCDDIKIWTDQSTTETLSLTPKSAHKYIPPSPVLIKKPKSVSPMSSILSTLFGTPPTYSNWYTADLQCEQAAPAVDSVESRNNSSLGNAGSYTCAGNGGSGSVFNAFMPIYGQKVQLKHKSNLFEEGISTLDYKTHNYESPKNSTSSKVELPSTSLPRTNPSNQSLTAFLQNAQSLSRNNTELEKENAHFRISEAIISAIEHIKWAKSQPCNERRGSDAIMATDWLESEHKTKDMASGDSNENNFQGEETLLAESSEYLPYSELSEHRFETMSAEVVGLSLISKFNDQQLPKVSELKWLVSDEDTPQQLLPMPDSSPTTNPDQNFFPPMTRGTRYWAPPRPQIIFTDHPAPNRKELIRKQNNRCAGCGMRVSQQNINSFRYCTYFGKYHCTGCHRNQMSATPAKILQMWDFKCYPVSVFAYRLLEQMYAFPLFYVPDLNPALYINSKQLLEARNKRVKLKYIKDFIKTCRFADREQSFFERIPDYIPNDPDTWSMSDFIDARNESMQRSIDELIQKCENHIFHCVLCTGRGFCCEYCLASRVIFPWSNKVYRCDRCGSCFHANCWKSMLKICCRCQRIRNRQSEIAEAICTDE